LLNEGGQMARKLVATLAVAVLMCVIASTASADGTTTQTYDTLVLLQPCTEFAGCIPAGSTTVDPAGVLIAQEFFTPCNFSSPSSCVFPPNCPNSNELDCTDGGATFFVISFIVQSDGTLTGFGEGTAPISSSAGEYWLAPGPFTCANGPFGDCISYWEATVPAPNEPVSWTAAPNGIFVFTPEPGTLALLIIGLLAALGMRYWRRLHAPRCGEILQG
jgi:hypothetical protein